MEELGGFCEADPPSSFMRAARWMWGVVHFGKAGEDGQICKKEDRINSSLKSEDTMNCPGCNHSDWEYPDVAIAQCKNCGYLLDPYIFGLKRDSSSSNLQRSENSKRWAKIALLVSVILYVVSLWIPDWSELWVIGAATSVILFLDALMYS